MIDPWRENLREWKKKEVRKESGGTLVHEQHEFRGVKINDESDGSSKSHGKIARMTIRIWSSLLFILVLHDDYPLCQVTSSMGIIQGEGERSEKRAWLSSFDVVPIERKGTRGRERNLQMWMWFMLFSERLHSKRKTWWDLCFSNSMPWSCQLKKEKGKEREFKKRKRRRRFNNDDGETKAKVACTNPYFLSSPIFGMMSKMHFLFSHYRKNHDEFNPLLPFSCLLYMFTILYIYAIYIRILDIVLNKCIPHTFHVFV